MTGTLNHATKHVSDFFVVIDHYDMQSVFIGAHCATPVLLRHGPRPQLRLLSGRPPRESRNTG